MQKKIISILILMSVFLVLILKKTVGKQHPKESSYIHKQQLRIEPLNGRSAYSNELLELHAQETKVDGFDVILKNDASIHNKLPYTYLAFYDDILVGSCSLVESCPIDTTLTPWACYLYVATEQRGKKIGKKLIEMILHKSVDLGYKEIFFYTNNPHIINMYQHLGGTIIHKAHFKGHEQTIMEGQLNNFISNATR